MESFIEKNREVNGHHKNVTFLHADVTKLEIPKTRCGFGKKIKDGCLTAVLLNVLLFHCLMDDVLTFHDWCYST